MSTIVNARIDLKSLGMNLTQWREFIGNNEWSVEQPKPVYSNHFRDIAEGWTRVSTVSEWQGGENFGWDRGLTKPGVYALVYESGNNVRHPILFNRTIMFGETTQEATRRVYTHIGALKGKSSNMTDKWRRHAAYVENVFGIDVFSSLDKIGIYFRPHEDAEFAYNRFHSQNMEKQAQAVYFALWKRFPPANHRDRPYTHLVETAKEYLQTKGIRQVI